ncbi:Sensor histidine kinase RcsC [bioreactor metagenome]|uniref:histidine kinase n=1 Tax=bioreactor metagenome TaxID=1076179 RepID=A0A644UQQ7_9ZZZZ
MQTIKLIKTTYRLVAIMVLFIVPIIAFASNSKQKTILYVSSFSQSTYWSEKTEESLLKTFKSENYNINLLRLYLDEEKTPKLEDRIDIVKNFFKNNKEKIDVIVVFDYGATKTFLNYSDSIISKIPIVFASEVDTESEIKFKNITGLSFVYGVSQTYKCGLRIFPNTKKVYVWADKSPTGKLFIKEAMAKLKGYNPDVEIEYGLNVGSLDELRKKCRSLDSNSFVIYGTWSLDSLGRKYSDEVLADIFFKEVKVPMFCTYDERIGKGFLGGFVQTPEINAVYATRKAIRILNGEFVDRMEIEHIFPTPIFDVRGIVRHDGSVKALPNSSVLVNKYSGYFLRYHIFLVPIIILFLLILFFLYSFFSQRYRNSKLRKSLREKEVSEKNLQENVKILSSAMPSFRILSWVYNDRTKTFNYGVTDDNGILEINKEGDLSIAKSFVSEEFEEKFTDFFSKLDLVKDMHEFHLEYFGRIPGEVKDTWWEIKGTINECDDSEGKYKILKAIHINIHRYKQIEIRLNDALDRAIRSDKLKSNFIANITHEIRTPLNAITGFANLINSDIDEELRIEYSNIIKENSDKLIEIINDIILISEIQSGYFELKTIVLDLSQYISELDSIFRYRFPSNIEFIVENPYQSCIVEVDKNRLFHIIKIFIDNAIKFTQQGFVKLGYKIEDNGIRFYCQDSGIGIKEEDKDNVFTLFEKVDSTKQGTGLGLGIVKSLVNKMGGKYGVESEIEKGSCFWFWLPSKKIITDKESKLSNVEIESMMETKYKVLIIENDNSTSSLFKDNDFSSIYDVYTSSPIIEEIMECISLNPPEIILLAQKAQYLDDYNTLKQIKMEYTSIPVIIVSEQLLFHEKAKLLNAGCNEFIELPIDFRSLHKKINGLIG